MKIQGITNGTDDFQQPRDKGLSIGQTDLKEPKDTGIPAVQPDREQSTGAPDLSRSVRGDIPAGLFELLQRKQNDGLAELQALKENPQVDMGSIKSRDLGNMLSGELVRLGEAAAKAQNPNVDFGDLPSRTLTEMGKDVIKSE